LRAAGAIAIVRGEGRSLAVDWGRYAELLELKVAESPLARSLDARSVAAITAIVAAPLAFSYCSPCRKADRPDMAQVLSRLRVPQIIGSKWLRGLVEQGHARSTIDALQAAGLLDFWDLHSGAAATLSPLAAERIGIELVELHQRDPVAIRWTVARPRRRVKIRQRFAVNQDVLLSVVDGAPGPVANAEAAERWTRGKPEVLDASSDAPLLLCGARVFIDPKLLKAPRGRPRGGRKNQNQCQRGSKS
jgi:hypothetical protein